MSKEYFIELAGFNRWANDIVQSWLEQITDEQWSQPIVSSFNSIGETVIHVIGAELIWLDRLKGVEQAKQVWFASVFKGSKKEAIETWKKSSQDLETFLKGFDETKMKTGLYFKRLNGDEYNVPHYQVLAHIFNHATYHRGQLVTMLRQIGFTDVSSTDITFYFR